MHRRRAHHRGRADEAADDRDHEAHDDGHDDHDHGVADRLLLRVLHHARQAQVQEVDPVERDDEAQQPADVRDDPEHRAQPSRGIGVRRDLDRLVEVLLPAEGGRQHVDDEAQHEDGHDRHHQLVDEHGHRPAHRHAEGAQHRHGRADDGRADEARDGGERRERQHVAGDETLGGGRIRRDRVPLGLRREHDVLGPIDDVHSSLPRLLFSKGESLLARSVRVNGGCHNVRHERAREPRRDPRSRLFVRQAPAPARGEPRHRPRTGGGDPGHQRLGQDHAAAAAGRLAQAAARHDPCLRARRPHAGARGALRPAPPNGGHVPERRALQRPQRLRERGLPDPGAHAPAGSAGARPGADEAARRRPSRRAGRASQRALRRHVATRGARARDRARPAAHDLRRALRRIGPDHAQRDLQPHPRAERRARLDLGRRDLRRARGGKACRLLVYPRRGRHRGARPDREMLESNDPFVRQFLHAETDGPVRFHFPARPLVDELGMANRGAPSA
nr:basic proline-rich protein precursor [uncultured bacterium]